MCSTSNVNVFASQFHREIAGRSTEFVFHRFADKWLLLITQYGKIANFYTVKFDVQRSEGTDIIAPVDNPTLHTSVPVTMTCVFGADKDEVRSGIQFLINKTNLYKCPTEILVCLGLKETNGTVLREIVALINTIIK